MDYSWLDESRKKKRPIVLQRKSPGKMRTPAEDQPPFETLSVVEYWRRRVREAQCAEIDSIVRDAAACGVNEERLWDD